MAQNMQTIHQNRHHLLYQGRHWDKGRAKELRNFFVYKVDAEAHNELHNYVLHDVPRPEPAEFSRFYARFLQDRWRLESYDMLEALDWLIENCDSFQFRIAMAKQADFFEKHLP